MPKPEVKVAEQHWLTDEQIAEIVAAASADDIIEALALYPDAEKSPLMISREIFNRSADRLGLSNGTKASAMVQAHRFASFTEALRDLVRSDSPLSEATDLLPISADSGE